MDELERWIKDTTTVRDEYRGGWSIELHERLAALATLPGHEPGCDTDSDYDFGSMWLTCSCGWVQKRDEPWSAHVRAALSGGTK